MSSSDINATITDHCTPKIERERRRIQCSKCRGSGFLQIKYLVHKCKSCQGTGYSQFDLYVIGCMENELVKIGISINLEQRLLSLQAGSPVRLEVIFNWQVPIEARRIEMTVHSRLDKYKVYGEWFNVELSIITEAVKDSLDVLLPLLGYRVNR